MPNKRKTVRSLDLPPDTFGGGSLLLGSSGGNQSVAPPVVAPPDAPSGVTVSAALLSSECHPAVTLTVSWTEPTLRVPMFYLIDYSTDAGFAPEATLTAVSADTQITIGGLGADTTYYVRVAAVAAQRSAWSTAVSLTTPSIADDPVHVLLVPTWGGAGASDGIWRWRSDTAAWTLHNSGLPAGLGWYAVAINPTNPSEWVALGMSASGETNSHVAKGYNTARITATGASNALQIAGATTSPFWRTTDDGDTWTPLEVRGTLPGSAYEWLHLFFDDDGALHIVAHERAMSGGSPINAGRITRWRGSAGSVLTGVGLTFPPGTPNYNEANIAIRGACAGEGGDLVMSVFHYELNSGEQMPIVVVAPDHTLVIPFYTTRAIRSLARAPLSRALIGIAVDGNDINRGVWRTPDYDGGTQIFTDADTPSHYTAALLADLTALIQSGQGESGAASLEGWEGVFAPGGGYSKTTLYGPLAGGEYLRHAAVDLATGTTAVVNIYASTNAAPGKDVLFYDGVTWQRLTGPAAATDDQLREHVAISLIPGDAPCVHGCPPNAHHANHEIGGCDPLLLQLIDGTLTDIQHGARGGGTLHALATAVLAGFMAPEDKTRLDALPAPTAAGQLLMSLDGADWSRVRPVTSTSGWIVNAQGELLVSQE